MSFRELEKAAEQSSAEEKSVWVKTDVYNSRVLLGKLEIRFRSNKWIKGFTVIRHKEIKFREWMQAEIRPDPRTNLGQSIFLGSRKGWKTRHWTGITRKISGKLKQSDILKPSK